MHKPDPNVLIAVEPFAPAIHARMSASAQVMCCQGASATQLLARFACRVDPHSRRPVTSVQPATSPSETMPGLTMPHRRRRSDKDNENEEAPRGTSSPSVHSSGSKRARLDPGASPTVRYTFHLQKLVVVNYRRCRSVRRSY